MSVSGSLSDEQAMALAICEASKYIGATAPNPPVGAVALDLSGYLLAKGAHERAGLPHAEINTLRDFESAKSKGLLPANSRIHTLAVTLEPCNHFGKTPPCTDAILRAGIQRVLIGTKDPNPHVLGRGAERLRKHGIEVIQGVEESQARQLIRGFAKRSQTGLPYVVVKQAFLADGLMIPPSGQKTFTGPSSLRYAHELRRKSDAILTGVGTVLADAPEFTVRHLPDHLSELKQRWLIVMDRQHRVPQRWVQERERAGFRVRTDFKSVEAALKFLGEQGCLEVLVEAGPTLGRFILGTDLWDEQIKIIHRSANQEDEIQVIDRAAPLLW